MGGDCDESTIQSDIIDEEIPAEESKHSNRKRKPRSKLKDPLSTGRKEAARLYPFLNDDGSIWKKGDPLEGRAKCEWANREGVGGGKYPIRGCGFNQTPVGKQLHRHHGPDKNTLNNERGNVHRICYNCHNRWHAANDDDYDPSEVKSD